MNKKLWEPSKTLKLNSNLLKFEKFISIRFKKKFNRNYEKIHNWTIKNPQSFWNFCETPIFLNTPLDLLFLQLHPQQYLVHQKL